MFVKDGFGESYGTCDNPKTANKSIRISDSIRGELLLDTLIHEMLHAAFWDLSESAIEQTASDMASVIMDNDILSRVFVGRLCGDSCCGGGAADPGSGDSRDEVHD